MSPRLKAPVRRQPGTVGQFKKYRRPDEQCLAGKIVQTDAVISPQIPRLAAQEEAWTNLSHHGYRGANGRFPLRLSGRDNARPFRLIDQVEGRDTEVRDKFAVESDRELGTVFPHPRSGRLVEAIGAAFHGERQTERILLAVQQAVA